MADNKKSFVAYTDWGSIFNMLTDDEAGKLAKHLFNHASNQETTLNDRMLKVLFEPIRLQLERDNSKYETVKERRKEAGRKGGLKSGETRKQNEAIALDAKQNEANEAVIVNGNDTVNVNDNDILLKKETKERRFKPPALSEVEEYISEKNYSTVSAQSFWNFYESKNWFVGKNKMKDWKKAIAGWESRNKEIPNTNGKSNNHAGTGAANGYRAASVDTEGLIRELTSDLENGNIPGQY